MNTVMKKIIAIAIACSLAAGIAQAAAAPVPSSFIGEIAQITRSNPSPYIYSLIAAGFTGACAYLGHKKSRNPRVATLQAVAGVIGSATALAIGYQMIKKEFYFNRANQLLQEFHASCVSNPFPVITSFRRLTLRESQIIAEKTRLFSQRQKAALTAWTAGRKIGKLVGATAASTALSLGMFYASVRFGKVPVAPVRQ
jgi:hypothetical protein